MLKIKRWTVILLALLVLSGCGAANGRSSDANPMSSQPVSQSSQEGIPAIVLQDLFDRVQEKLAKNKEAPAHHRAEDDYLLTNKLFCGYCGAYLCGESGASHTGNVHHYYKCVSVEKKRAECRKKSVKKIW